MTDTAYPDGRTKLLDAWAEDIQTAADKLTANVFNWKEIEFNWADRYIDGDPDPTVVDQLIIAAARQFLTKCDPKVQELLESIPLESDDED